MVLIHGYAEAFAITKIRKFKHEPFFLLGAEGGVGLIVVCNICLSVDHRMLLIPA